MSLDSTLYTLRQSIEASKEANSAPVRRIMLEIGFAKGFMDALGKPEWSEVIASACSELTDALGKGCISCDAVGRVEDILAPIGKEAKNYKGYYHQDNIGRMELPPNILEMRTLNANGYYVFNHKRFSYPAAMTQGYIQRRSAGSFMLALGLQAQEGEYDYLKEFKTRITNIGVGGGYGYNYVPARRWMIHLSALPTFIVYNHTWMIYDGSRVKVGYHFPEVIITGRGAIVYQIKKNQFAALSGVYYFTNIGGKKHLEIENEKWRARLTYGIRL